MELFRQLVNRQTDGRTDGLTELFLKSLSRLKRFASKVGDMLAMSDEVKRNRKMPSSSTVSMQLMDMVSNPKLKAAFVNKPRDF